MQNDSYYENLPFTLPVEQSDPDYVILGTGLQECLIAAHLTKIQNKRGLILDLEKTYGSYLKTTTIKELHLLNTNQQEQKLYKFITPESWKTNNQIFIDGLLQRKQYRGYNIDIQPNFFFGSSVACQMLKQAQMDKYMDFRLVYHMLSFEDNQFHQVPLSKGKIFQSKSLSLLEKKNLLSTLHTITKIYNKIMKVEENQNSTNQFDKDFTGVNQEVYQQFINNYEKLFVDTLLKITKKNKKIMNYLIYIICNYQYNYEGIIPEFMKSDYTIRGFLERFGKFIKSCGIYGEGPYLYVDNGIGDIPQAFSRIASIFGSVYILHPKITIESIIQKDDKLEIFTNLVPEKPITANKIFYGPTFFNRFNKQNSFIEQKTLRILLICQKSGQQNDCPSIGYFLDLQPFKNPIYLFTFDDNSHSCPKNYIIYQFETIILDQKQNYQQQIKILIEALQKVRGPKFQESIKYVSSYIRTRIFPNQKEIQPENGREIWLRDNSGIDLDGHFINMIKIVGQHPFYFKKLDDSQSLQEVCYQETDNLIQKLHSINLNQLQSTQTPIKSDQPLTLNQKTTQTPIQSSPTIVRNQNAIVQNQNKIEGQSIKKQSQLPDQKAQDPNK